MISNSFLENILFYLLNLGKFFHEVKENDTNSIKESEKVFNLLHVWKDDAQTRLLCELAALREHDVLIAQKN